MPTITGTEAGDSLNGGLDDDLVQGLGGPDTLRGGGGRDTLDGGADGDTLLDDSNGGGRFLGGSGDDYVSISSLFPLTPTPTQIHVDGGDGDDRVYVRVAPFQGASISATLIGGSGADSLTVSGDVTATIDGGAGDDSVTVTGQGSRGATVTLGAGSDRLRFDPNGGSRGVVVTDFQPGAGGDYVVIDLSYQIINWDGVANPFASGHFRLLQQGSDTVLQRDPDGPGASADVFMDIIRFQNTSAGSFTAFNLFDWSPNGSAASGGVILGTDASDRLTGTPGPDSIHGRGESDEVFGAAGTDTVDGGDGDDVVYGQGGGDSLQGGAGNDYLYGAGDDVPSGNDTLGGGDGRDNLSAGDGDDLLMGDAGRDLLWGDQGDDVLIGGIDDDQLKGDAGSDTLDGDDGADWLEGGTGADLLTGGAGGDSFVILGLHTSLIVSDMDTINDWSSADRLLFQDNAGHELGGGYVEATATDIASAGARAASLLNLQTRFVAVQVGADVVVFAAGSSVNATLTESVRLAGRTLADISETSISGAFARPPPDGSLSGTPGADNVLLTSGSDTYDGAAGADTVLGLDGADSIAGGGGDDRVFAGGGNDTVTDLSGANYLRGDEGDDRIAGGADFDDINGNMGNDTASGGLGDDWVVGGKDNDSLSGGDGYDLVYGNIGADTCEGGDGNDIVRGGQDNDLVLGGAGADYVSGDRGSDTVTGGAGADIFHTFGDAGLDRVTDFSLAEGDRVQLDPGTQHTVSQVGGDTVISMTGGGQMILVGVQMSSLTAGWIFGA